NNISVHFNYAPHLVNIVKQIPGRTFHPKAKFWYFQADGNLTENISILRKAGFAIDDKLRERINPPPEAFAPVLEANIASESPIFSKLYPFQRETAEWMIRAKSGLICSFCGSGKTITSLAALSALQAQNNL